MCCVFDGVASFHVKVAAAVERMNIFIILL